MGMFDTVYVTGDVAAAFRLRCDRCGAPPHVDDEWQTKSLDPAMFAYVLRHDDVGAVRLYRLDPPADRSLWRAYSDQEIEESRRAAAEHRRLAAFALEPGDGYFLPAAFLPGNRRHRFMGDLPHQWVEIYRACSCGAFVDRAIKFSDGIAGEVRARSPAWPLDEDS